MTKLKGKKQKVKNFNFSLFTFAFFNYLRKTVSYSTSILDKRKIFAQNIFGRIFLTKSSQFSIVIIGGEVP